MNILAVDTTEDALSLALLAGERVLSVDRKLGAPHDEALFWAVDRLLGKAGLAIEDLSALAAASGPGRFTGIRIGMTFAAVASERLGIPALAVSRLEALAFKTPGRLVCAVIPGWKDEKFHQVFERKGRLRPKAPPAWTTAEGWVQARASIEATGAAVVEACPGARDILGLAVELLGRAKRPRFEPLYLKLAGYERVSAGRGARPPS
ncbi:MAG: tRNA (adenosine(37)-N6)-threonylcarbamoyltransferase complex dimerization subunit type 1 TsaB [Elusimicrobia bacterium]|nr:tRNA (adenosine(37)-N6)-threonylcarbamoyltransferase complex dimerization subunit type 1 TsaB [Elusimicrobiota bacterium]